MHKNYIALPVSQVFYRSAWAKDPVFNGLRVLIPCNLTPSEAEIRRMRRDNLTRILAIAIDDLHRSLNRAKCARSRRALSTRLKRLSSLNPEAIPLPRSFLLSYENVRTLYASFRTDTRVCIRIDTQRESVHIPISLYRRGYSLSKTLSILRGNVLEFIEDESNEEVLG